MRAFESVYRYALHGKVSNEELESIILTFLNKTQEITHFIENGDDDSLINLIISYIGELMWEYRNYYTLYGELSGEFVEEIPVPLGAIEKVRKAIQENYSEKQK